MAHHVSFKHAWDGIKHACGTQPNFRVHAIIGSLVVVFAIVFQVSRVEWIVLLLSITLVIVAEMINTSIESMTDLIEQKHHRHAKIAKDVSAGMVLISAIAAVIVGLVIFIPKILLAIRY